MFAHRWLRTWVVFGRCVSVVSFVVMGALVVLMFDTLLPYSLFVYIYVSFRRWSIPRQAGALGVQAVQERDVQFRWLPLHELLGREVC